jgi:two-component sensor histidine kinase
MSLRFRLSVLAAIAVVPPLALIAYNTYAWRNFLERDTEADTATAARLVSAELAQFLDGARDIMLTIVKHPAVPNNEQECTAYFKTVIADLPIYREAAVIDRDGKFHCSTIPIPPTLDVRDRAYFAEPLQTGRLTVGTLTIGRVTGQASMHVSMPYRVQGQVEGVVVLILDPEKIVQAFGTRAWHSDYRLGLFDREGSLVFSIPQDGAPAARLLGKKLFGEAQNTSAGTVMVESGLGRGEIVGFAPVGATNPGLFVTVGVDRDVALAEVRNSLWRSVVFGLMAILLAIVGLWLASDRLLRRPVLAMLDTARRREAGDIGARFPVLPKSSELGQLSSALAGMSEKVDHLLEQQSFLMRELQHRVMNSLNILSSLLMLQGKHSSEPAVRDQLSRARERVLAMGAVYRHLYSIDTAGRVEFGEFLKMICSESERAYVGASRHAITCEADQVEVSGSQATSLAVLAHELITNALKHAYPQGQPGPISVRLRHTEDGSVELRVADRGRGIPPHFNIDQPNSLGFKVIMATARQFGGAVSINRLDPGTEIVIRFPADFGAVSKSPAAAASANFGGTPP